MYYLILVMYYLALFFEMEVGFVKWVTMWGNAQSKVMPAPQTYAKDLTLRYPMLVPFSGSKIRITLDNFCVNESVKIDYVCVGIGNSLSDEVGAVKYLTFNGNTSVVINAFDNVTSDELEFKVNDGEFLVVSLYCHDYVNLTGGVDVIGPLSKGYFAYGNQIERKKLDINTSKSTSWVYFLSNVDVYTEDSNEAIICYGDSITSQNWPDELLLALRDENIKNISVVRKAVSGTRILRQYNCITYQSYGLCGKNRFIHEVSSVSGAKKIIVQQGINDIIHPVGEDVNIFRPMSDLPKASDLIEGMKYYECEAKKLGLDFYVGTLLPIYGWRTYENFREKLKNDFNYELKQLFKTIDFASVVGDNINGVWHFKENCDSGDHLHPSKYAYRLMGVLAMKKII